MEKDYLHAKDGATEMRSMIKELPAKYYASQINTHYDFYGLKKQMCKGMSKKVLPFGNRSLHIYDL